MRAKVAVEASSEDLHRFATALSKLLSSLLLSEGCSPSRVGGFGEAIVGDKYELIRAYLAWENGEVRRLLGEPPVPEKLFKLTVQHTSNGEEHRISGYVSGYVHLEYKDYLFFLANDGGIGVMKGHSMARIWARRWQGVKVLKVWWPEEFAHIPVSVDRRRDPLEVLKELGEGIYRVTTKGEDGSAKKIYVVVGRTSRGRLMAATPGVKWGWRYGAMSIERVVLPYRLQG